MTRLGTKLSYLSQIVVCKMQMMQMTQPMKVYSSIPSKGAIWGTWNWTLSVRILNGTFKTPQSLYDWEVSFKN
jgi:hypothetical protein